MNEDINKIVANINYEIDKEVIDELITSYQPFILKIVSQEKNKYIEIENDDEFQIGLIAFDEAIKKYNVEKGSFLSFARLVIKSRLNNYWGKGKKQKSIDIENINVASKDNIEDQYILREEILEFERELKKYKINFETLIEQSPKHSDTRKRTVELGFKIASEADLVEHLIEKKRLPISEISKRFSISIKIIKRNKNFIIAIVIIKHMDYKKIYKFINK